HEHNVKPRTAHARRVYEYSNLTGDFACGQIPDKTHLAGQAEPAAHRASDLRRDAERHGRGVRDENRLKMLLIGEAKDELLGSVDRLFSAGDQRGRDCEVMGERSSKLVRQVRHPLEGRNALAVYPPEDLASAKALVPTLLEDVFKSRPLQLAEFDVP